MKKLKEHYSFIILDLPPVTAVADAVAASRLADGMIMVVRSGYTARRALADALRQLTLAGARILGFVFVGAEGKKYQKKGYAGYPYQYAGKGQRAAKGGPPWTK